MTPLINGTEDHSWKKFPPNTYTAIDATGKIWYNKSGEDEESLKKRAKIVTTKSVHELLTDVLPP